MSETGEQHIVYSKRANTIEKFGKAEKCYEKAEIAEKKRNFYKKTLVITERTRYNMGM